MADSVGSRPAGLAPECVAMAHGIPLVPSWDIHCGGMDLVFPHHENEIAQARAPGDGFARYWLHNGWVTMGGEKMSKSLGNVLAIPAVLQPGLSSCVTTWACTLSVDAGVLRGCTSRDAARAYTGLRGIPASGQNADRCGDAGELDGRFGAALDDDLAVPAALAEVHNARAEGNRAMRPATTRRPLAKPVKSAP